ncbi:MAG: hypothetical protein Q9191_003006 [Dirinaria sp. TL-2023a]
MKFVNRYPSFSALLYLSIFFGSAVVAALLPLSSSGGPVLTNLPNSTDGNIRFLNSTSLDTIDPDFVLLPRFKGRKLFPVSCLLVAVDAALQLALGNFEGMVAKTVVFKLDDYPQVEIVLLPYDVQGQPALPWKYAVWALNRSINVMIANGNYQSSIFLILRKDKGVGALSYRSTQPLSSKPRSISLQDLEDGNDESVNPLHESSLRPDLNTTGATNSSNSVAANADFVTYFKLFGSRMAPNDIFITSLDLLRAFAVFPRTARIDSGVTEFRVGNSYLKYRDPNNPPRTKWNPPYFENEWMLRAVSLMPGYMVKRQSFKEVNVKISVAEIIIGEVDLTKNDPSLGLATS